MSSVGKWMAVAGLLFCGGLVGCQGPVNDAWRVEPSDHGVALVAGRQQLLTYRDRNIPFKPYVETLRTPSGVNILRDAPGDHLHHHGLMYAVNVDGVEFWGEVEPAGRQVPGEMQTAKPTRVRGWARTSVAQPVVWQAPADKKTVLLEQRRIEAYRGKDLDASLLTWQTTLRTPPGAASCEISGRHYFGLGMRFVESMDKGGKFINADGRTGVDGTNNIRSRWCAYTASADGRVVTIAVFDHPANPRHPATWFTMDNPFAYISDTPDVHHQPIALAAGQPLCWRFGVALWDGTIDPAGIETLYQRWVSLPIQ